jgi:hypothetical protein
VASDVLYPLKEISYKYNLKDVFVSRFIQRFERRAGGFRIGERALLVTIANALG